jgi:hypothetical protein
MPVMSAAEMTAPAWRMFGEAGAATRSAETVRRSTGAFEESLLPLLGGGRRGRRRQPQAGQVGQRLVGRGRSDRRGIARFSRGEQTAGARGLDLLKPALLLGTEAGLWLDDARGRHGLAAVLGADDRPAEIARQRRAELWHATIVARQTL